MRLSQPWPPVLAILLLTLWSWPASAQSGAISGTVRDETGGVLPGVVVQLRPAGSPRRASEGAGKETASSVGGRYAFNGVANGRYELSFTLVNFGSARAEVEVNDASARVDAVLHLALSADVIVSGKGTFSNLADVTDPQASLIGVAQSASQGAITARQLEARPILRPGEVLETVPGVVISQHSGEGKANQYYLRGFNLDHGTDFATTVAGMPVNVPTHGHGHGYSDTNFLIPELVSGVQYSKGPYFAEQGDFATAGAANINYVNFLDAPMVRVSGGQDGFGRVLAAASRGANRGAQWLGALEVEHNDGPWDVADDYRKVNGVVRYSRGSSINGLSVTGMAYRAIWTSTDQVPQRALDAGTLDRFGSLDDSDGGDTARFSASLEWQRAHEKALTRVVAYGIGYDLNLYSNFTYFLDDPDNGDQFHQADRRFVSGGRLTHRRLDTVFGRGMQNIVGAQLRRDDISKIGLYHTVRRVQLETVREDAVGETSVGGFAQNETAWTPWLRSLAGLRVDGFHFNVDSDDVANSGTASSGIASPKGGLVLGPWAGTELYANAGFGFHSNDARGATITRDPKTGEPADAVTPLVRARGSEIGLRTVAVPHLQSSVSLWSLSLDSELVFVGDAGTTEAGRPSHRWGLELANYYSPMPWLTVDADVSWSRARFEDDDPAGPFIPGAVGAVVSAGLTIDKLRNAFGSVRVRYFGPRPLIEDDSVRSRATSLLNLQAGYVLSKRARVSLDLFNLMNVDDSDIDYYYPSRLPGEPADGVDDIHLHPAVPRTARVNLQLSF